MSKQPSKRKPVRIVKINIPGGEAKPGPPVGTSLTGTGVKVFDFVKFFNATTANRIGDLVPTTIYILDGKGTFECSFTEPPVSSLLKKLVAGGKGSAVPNRDKVGTITEKDVEVIAKRKIVDTNARSLSQAMQLVKGTARSMGIDIKG